MLQGVYIFHKLNNTTLVAEVIYNLLLATTVLEYNSYTCIKKSLLSYIGIGLEAYIKTVLPSGAGPS